MNARYETSLFSSSSYFFLSNKYKIVDILGAGIGPEHLLLSFRRASSQHVGVDFNMQCQFPLPGPRTLPTLPIPWSSGSGGRVARKIATGRSART